MVLDKEDWHRLQTMKNKKFRLNFSWCANCDVLSLSFSFIILTHLPEHATTKLYLWTSNNQALPVECWMCCLLVSRNVPLMFVLKVWRCPDWEYTVKEKKNRIISRMFALVYIHWWVGVRAMTENTDLLNERKDRHRRFFTTIQQSLFVLSVSYISWKDKRKN